MKSRVYVETTTPGFYHEVRPEPDMVARREWTRAWWDNAHPNASKFGHSRRVNAMLGLFVPLLVTPLELLGGQIMPWRKATEKTSKQHRDLSRQTEM